MNELKHPCASKCPEYKDEQCNHCLVKVNCHQSMGTRTVYEPEFCNGDIVVLKNDNYQSIMKMGKRGTVREAHVLFINIKDWKLFKLKDFLQHCKKNASFDIISFTVSNNNPLKNILMKNMLRNILTLPVKFRQKCKV